MSNPRLSVLRRQLKVPAPAPAAVPAPAADDLAGMLQAMVDAAVARHLEHAPPRPASGSRLHALEAKLAQLQPSPADTPVRDLRQLFDMPPTVPTPPPAGVLPAEPIREVLPVSRPSGRAELRVAERDANGFIRSVAVNSEAGAHTVTVQQRDPRGRMTLIDFGDGRRLNARYDDLRQVMIVEPVVN